MPSPPSCFHFQSRAAVFSLTVVTVVVVSVLPVCMAVVTVVIGVLAGNR